MLAPSDEARAALVAAAPVLADTLEGACHAAARVLSPAGCETWLAGALAMTRLGRGPELVVAWVENAPLAAAECGEGVIDDALAAISRLASLTSGAVLVLALETLPAAARRLGDDTLVAGYLALLQRLAGRAPRGLRPMLGHVDELLAVLTLSGMERWADFGAEAHKRDFTAQAAYFALQSEDSRAVLQRERRGTLFVATQRKLGLYLRALWGRDFLLRPVAVRDGGLRPWFEDGMIHLPDAVDDCAGVSGTDLYRAMAAHLAAHLAFPCTPPDKTLAPAERFFVGLVEDARVECLAMREFPGMGALWRRLHGAADAECAEHPVMPLIEGIALALLEPSHRVGDPELDGWIAEVHAAFAECGEDPGFSHAPGRTLHALIAARQALPSLRILGSVRIPYRDDNRVLDEAAALRFAEPAAPTPAQVRRRISMMEFVNQVDVETAGDDAQEVWTLDGVLYDDDGTTYNERKGREWVGDPVRYPEWDYRAQTMRPDWATVLERRAPRDEPARIDAILREHKGIVSRIRRVVDQLRPQRVTRRRKLEDGDEIDINAAIEAVVQLRAGRQPDTRIAMRNVLNHRDIAVLVLLDLSESTNERVRGSTRTVLELTREACALVATAIDGIGDRFAIHGFASDGRHDVRYLRMKDFDAPFDAAARARLAGMQGGLSTRMGTAMRHAGRHLLGQPARRRLLLVVTDGEPADIDERDPLTLREDARKAVEELHARGVDAYCLTLDAHADRYVERIFGPARHTVVDDVRKLPERLPALFASLTR